MTVEKRDAADLYVVWVYDGFDREWFDLCEPVSYEKALALYNEKTKNGTEKTSFREIDYYSIFKAAGKAKG